MHHDSRATFPILSRDPSFQETLKTQVGNSDKFLSKERGLKRMGNQPLE